MLCKCSVCSVQRRNKPCSLKAPKGLAPLLPSSNGRGTRPSRVLRRWALQKSKRSKVLSFPATSSLGCWNTIQNHQVSQTKVPPSRVPSGTEESILETLQEDTCIFETRRLGLRNQCCFVDTSGVFRVVMKWHDSCANSCANSCADCAARRESISECRDVLRHTLEAQRARREQAASREGEC